MLREKSLKLPLLPGVYLMKNAKGEIIYIGKAKALKNRVSTYFGADTGHTRRVKKMISQIDSFDYIVTDSEFEALVLECSLIKQHMPKYNVLLKDDKGYHYIRISSPPFPRIRESKQILDDGAEYLGPYISSYTVREVVDEANRVFQLPTCNRVFEKGKRERPCLNYYIKQCSAPCAGKVTESAYMEQFEEALQFIRHGSDKAVADLKRNMGEASEKLDYEKAARFRDRIKAIDRLSEKQKVVMSRVEEQDVIAFARGSDVVACEVFRFTKGRLYDREDFFIEGIGEMPSVREEFIRSYYTMRDNIPSQITIDGEVENGELLERWLTEKAKRRVYIVIPKIGEQAHLVEMCRTNAAERLARQTGMMGRDAAALDELARLLGLEEPPIYIESYDISHTAGSDTVGGMVVFKNAKPYKKAYRRFLIKEAESGDDYGAMVEVLTRRFDEYYKHFDKGDKEGFGKLPDLILLDGGKGQVGVIEPVIEGLGLDVPVFGMVKDDRHRTRAIAVNGGEIAINSKRTAFTLVSKIQEEVHRYAISYHRQRRRKSGIGTVLTEIEGVGAKRAKALLVYFKSIKAISDADVDEIAKVPGFSKIIAQKVRQFFDERED